MESWNEPRGDIEFEVREMKPRQASQGFQNSLHVRDLFYVGAQTVPIVLIENFYNASKKGIAESGRKEYGVSGQYKSMISPITCQ